VDAVLAAVRKATGPAAVLKTISYSLNPTTIPPNGEEPTITGYSAVNVVQVTLDDLGKSARSSTARRLPGPITAGHPVHAARSDAVRAEALRQRRPGRARKPRCSPRRSD